MSVLLFVSIKSGNLNKKTNQKLFFKLLEIRFSLNDTKSLIKKIDSIKIHFVFSILITLLGNVLYFLKTIYVIYPIR